MARVQSNVKFYIAVTSHIFRDYICGWLGSAHDCNALHSTSIDVPFKNFRATNILQAMSDIEQNNYLKALNASSIGQNDFEQETGSQCSYLEVKKPLHFMLYRDHWPL